MLNEALISTPALPLHETDTVLKAMQLLEELKTNAWPVVNDGQFKGMISEDSLLNADEGIPISELSYDYLPVSAAAGEHFMAAVRIMAEYGLDVVAVTDTAGEFLGVILQSVLFQHLAVYAGGHMPGGMVVMEVNPQDFSPGEICRLVETNNAQVRQLNTKFDVDSGYLKVSIRINKEEISDIIATLQRYDYRILYFAGEEQYENELRRNYHHLVHFLEM